MHIPMSLSLTGIISQRVTTMLVLLLRMTLSVSSIPLMAVTQSQTSRTPPPQELLLLRTKMLTLTAIATSADITYTPLQLDGQ